ncbi:MAG: molybdopterin-binding/glycosyltransferase family 2 protein [Halioglobus sp.]
MIFASFDCENAEGVVLAHTLRLAGTTLKKGRVLSLADLALLQENGIHAVSGVRLDAGDVDEDQAALELAHALAGPMLEIGKPVAGRCYLYARSDGLAQIDSETINAINCADAGIFVATLPVHAECVSQQAVGSIKVIPFAVPRQQLDHCIELAGAGTIGLRPFRRQSVALVLTEAPGLKETVLQSTSAVTAGRLKALGGELVFEARCPHSVEGVRAALTEALASEAELILICGASITVDPADIIPSSIVQCGGVVDHFGMPVEPGNMLLLAHIGERTVINLPGCSRSPKLNGLDWVMQRMAAGLPMNKSEILSMGVGGLIKDISHRWRMREQARLVEEVQEPYKVAAIVLAAGQSRRMGEQHKLQATVDDVPMIQRVVDAALQAEIVSTTVITGNRALELEQLLKGRDISLVHNPDYREGIASSLKRGLASLPSDIDGVMILLADMPFITATHINELLAEFNPANERDIVAPIREGRLGNPVTWSTRYIPTMMQLSGDRGARSLLEEYAANVWEVPMGDDAIFMDVDTPAALEEANRRARENGRARR